MEEGHWDRHVRKIRKIYRKKHAALLAAVKRMMSGQVRVIGQDSGLHVLLRIGNGMTEDELLQAAARAGVKVYPTSNYWGEGAIRKTPPCCSASEASASRRLKMESAGCTRPGSRKDEEHE
ncbi:GntR family transcriptional regulator with aminotransferase domain [Paenibacillus thiaminolyticus]|nr:GntR family transcriptional regulator with aminotransferase domain [Paenibacillus thiaminolyticus]